MDAKQAHQGQEAGQLSPEHLAMLAKGSGLTEEVIRARGYRTITAGDLDVLRKLGFARTQLLPGLLLPLWEVDGQQRIATLRPDHPRQSKEGKALKYEFPKGAAMRLDCPPGCQPQLKDPSVPLWVTEGQKKADALVSRGFCAVALLGVWNFKGTNPFGGTMLLGDFDYIAWTGRDVRIVFDSDVMIKAPVQMALDRLIDHLTRKKARVSTVYLPDAADGRKVGVDDYLLEHPVQELQSLVDQPKPTARAAAPVLELLEDMPESMTQPIAILGGRGHVATWLPTRMTVRESEGKGGQIIKHDPPLVVTKMERFVVRDDGTIFGEVKDKSVKALADLGAEVYLPEQPIPSRLWGTRGVKAYKAGRRAEPADVFCRMVEVVSRFVDFDHSLADQQTMAEMVAAYCLATWFLPAHDVIGFLWPNGDAGSGKSQMLYVAAELSYLGQVLLASGSYAALRDMADYGATLCFDDAETIADPRNQSSDGGDKRNLLLAGNRRGATAQMKQPKADGTWYTRHVNCFCPRLFSAIRVPDPVLASRSIVVPLVRTNDRARANSSPLDYAQWPVNREQLYSDLWGLALANVAKVAQHRVAALQGARLSGRNLEPWLAMLTMARWLDAGDTSGVLRRPYQRLRRLPDGITPLPDERGEPMAEQVALGSLFDRLEELSVSYQQERSGLEFDGLTTKVVWALVQVALAVDGPSSDDATYASNATYATLRQRREIQKKDLWVTSTGDLREVLVKAAEDEGDPLDEADLKRLSMRIGKVLGRMRLRRLPHNRGSRLWEFTPAELRRLCDSYAIQYPATLQTSGVTGVSGASGVTDDSPEIDIAALAEAARAAEQEER